MVNISTLLLAAASGSLLAVLGPSSCYGEPSNSTESRYTQAWCIDYGCTSSSSTPPQNCGTGAGECSCNLGSDYFCGYCPSAPTTSQCVYCPRDSTCSGDPCHASCVPSSTPVGVCPAGYPVDCGNSYCCPANLPVCCPNNQYCVSDSSQCSTAGQPPPQSSSSGGGSSSGGQYCSYTTFGSCSLQFCVDSSNETCWYVANGQQFNCASCTSSSDLNACAMRAAQALGGC